MVLDRILPVCPIVLAWPYNVIVLDHQLFHFLMQGLIHIEEKIAGSAINDDGQ